MAIGHFGDRWSLTLHPPQARGTVSQQGVPFLTAPRSVVVDAATMQQVVAVCNTSPASVYNAADAVTPQPTLRARAQSRAPRRRSRQARWVPVATAAKSAPSAPTQGHWVWHAGVPTDEATISTPQPIPEDSHAVLTTVGGSQQAEANRSVVSDDGGKTVPSSTESQVPAHGYSFQRRTEARFLSSNTSVIGHRSVTCFSRPGITHQDKLNSLGAHEGVDWVQATIAELPEDPDAWYAGLEERADGLHYPSPSSLSTNWNTTNFSVEEVQRIALRANTDVATTCCEPLGLNPVVNPAYACARDLAAAIQVASCREDSKLKLDIAQFRTVAALGDQLHELLPGDTITLSNLAFPPPWVLNGMR